MECGIGLTLSERRLASRGPGQADFPEWVGRIRCGISAPGSVGSAAGVLEALMFRRLEDGRQCGWLFHENHLGHDFSEVELPVCVVSR